MPCKGFFALKIMILYNQIPSVVPLQCQTPKIEHKIIKVKNSIVTYSS